MTDKTGARLRPYCERCDEFCEEILTPDAWSAENPGDPVAMSRISAASLLIGGVTAYCGRCLDTPVVWREAGESEEKGAALNTLIDRLKEPLNAAHERGDRAEYERAANELLAGLQDAFRPAPQPPFAAPETLSVREGEPPRPGGAVCVRTEALPFLFYLYEPHALEMAAEIVRRYNAHDKLCAALDRILTDWHGDIRNMEKSEPAHLPAVREALRKARGEK